MKQTKKQIARKILGLILIPFFTAVFVFDRFLLVFLIWLEQPKIKSWFTGQKEMTSSFVRVISFTLIYSIYLLFRLLF
jgi:hypothetical protein